MNKTATNVDDFIASYSEETQRRLNQIRSVIKKVVPEAQEGMGYGMPGYKLNGKPLVYFGAYTKHIGFYATPSGHKEFANELVKYKQGKGSVQFPLDRPLPIDLIERIVKYRVQENLSEIR